MNTIAPRIRLFLITLACMGSQIAFGQSVTLEETFIRGNIDYGNGDYASAENAYREVLGQSQSSELHYNLGNALAQQGMWSEAAFHFLRAYALDPGADAARANLLLAAERLDLDSDFPVLPDPANLLPEEQWVWIAAIAFWVSILLFFQVDLFARELPFRKTSSLLAFAVFLVAAVAAFQHNLFNQWSLVAGSEVPLRVAPTEQSPGESLLKEGDPVRVLGEQGAFFHIMTRNGDEGFIQASELHGSGKD